jgi:hypothetical protein
MSGAGRKPYIWTKEVDNKLLSEIKSGKSQISVTTSIGVGRDLINRRLRRFGFENFRDARTVLYLDATLA